MIWFVLILCLLNMVFSFFVTTRVIARIEKIEYLCKKFKLKDVDEDVYT